VAGLLFFCCPLVFCKPKRCPACIFSPVVDPPKHFLPFCLRSPPSYSAIFFVLCRFPVFFFSKLGPFLGVCFRDFHARPVIPGSPPVSQVESLTIIWGHVCVGGLLFPLPWGPGPFGKTSPHSKRPPPVLPRVAKCARFVGGVFPRWGLSHGDPGGEFLAAFPRFFFPQPCEFLFVICVPPPLFPLGPVFFPVSIFFGYLPPKDGRDFLFGFLWDDPRFIPFFFFFLQVSSVPFSGQGPTGSRFFLVWGWGVLFWDKSLLGVKGWFFFFTPFFFFRNVPLGSGLFS